MRAEYTIHTIATAPADSRDVMEKTRRGSQRTFNLVGTMAQSPQLLSSFFQLMATSEHLTFEAMEREILAMVISVHIGCAHCIAMHTAILKKLRAPESLILALKSGGPLSEPRHAVLREFAREVIETRGAVSNGTHDAFFSAGFTATQALEVIFFVSMLTMSIYTSRLTQVPVDDVLIALAS